MRAGSGRGRRRERHPLRHQRRQPARLRRRGDRGGCRPASATVEVGIHTHNDAECAVANSLAAVEAGARLVQGCVNGYGERCGNANLASILPALQLKMGFEVVSEEQLASLTPTSHYLDELCNMTPNPDRAYVGRNAFAHKAGMHAAGVATDASTFEHLEPARVGNERDILASELSGKATIRSAAERAGLELDDAAASGAVEQLKQREHRGYHYEAAQASFELLLRREAGVYEPLFELESFRVTTEKREGSRVETEATIKVVVDGERYVEVAEGNGPVNALDKALRAAIGARHPHLADVELTNYKVRILDEAHGTGAVTRVLLDSTDGQPRVGHDRRLGEHHRGLLGGLGRLARLRVPASMSDSIPLAKPEIGAREEELVLEVLRSGRLSLGPMGERFERAFAEWLGVEDAVAVSSGTTGLHLGVRALGWGPGDEVLTSPFSFVASANCLLYEGVKPVFCDVDPVTLNLDPAAAAAAVGERTAGILPVHIFGYPAAMPELEALASKHDLGLLEDACEALGAVDSEGRKVGARGHLATFAFYANKQMTTGEGGMVVPGDAAARRPPAQRAQPGPRRRHGLARSRRPRLQLPALRRRRRARRRPAGEARRDARRSRAG